MLPNWCLGMPCILLTRPLGLQTICAMLKILVILLYLLPANIQPVAVCDCPQVSDLQTTSQASGSKTIVWNGQSTATSYLVKYIRHSDGYISPEAEISGVSHTFNNLTAGSYTFYVAAVCDAGRSGFIGIEDIIDN